MIIRVEKYVITGKGLEALVKLDEPVCLSEFFRELGYLADQPEIGVKPIKPKKGLFS